MKRLKALVAKFVSVKGVIFAVATAALWFGKIDQVMWLGVAGLVIGGRAYEKAKGVKGE